MQHLDKIILILIMFFNFQVYADDNLRSAMKISSSAMKAEGARLKIVAQNIANKDSTGSTPGSNPYRRKIIFMKSKYDKNLGASKVIVKKIAPDNKTEFKKVFLPNHPAANKLGYVSLPNVDVNIENADSRESMRNYEANLNLLDSSKNMFLKTLDILK